MEASPSQESVTHKIKDLHRQLINNFDKVNFCLKSMLYTDEDSDYINRLDEIYVVLNLANHGLKELDQTILGIEPSQEQQESKAISIMARDHLKCLEKSDDPERILSRVRSSIKLALADSADQRPTNFEIDQAIRQSLKGTDQKRESPEYDTVVAA
jgi:hypothetical protein